MEPYKHSLVGPKIFEPVGIFCFLRYGNLHIPSAPDQVG